MPIQNKDDGTGVGGGTPAPDTTAGILRLSGSNDQLISALVLACLDEINALRVVPVVGLAAITPTAWIAKIAAKKT